MPSGVVTFRRENVGGVGHGEFTADVLTGGQRPPQVTLHGNSGFPAVQDIYARAVTVEGGIGRHRVVRVHVRFNGTISGNANAISVNMYQEDASRFTYPWFSLLAEGEQPMGCDDVETAFASEKALAGQEG